VTSRALRRIRNAVRRIEAGQPRGLVSPLVPNDLFRVHAALYEFFAAFTVGRSVLVDDGQAAWGASAIAQSGARSVTAVVPSPRARRFAERTYAALNLRFVAAPDEGTYDVIISGDETLRSRLAAGGIWITTGAPPGGFAATMRFAQIAETPIDYASPFPSQATFVFRPDAPPGAAVVKTITVATDQPKWRELQLHVGCGPQSLAGWINIDNQPYAGVDFRWDLARGIPFAGARFVFAEHFIEHLSFDQAEQFVRAARQALRDDGILRLTTPNLEYVVRTFDGTPDPLHRCFDLNRAFRGWGHQFLYNIDALEMLLRRAGFAAIRRFDYGQSDTPALAGIERHERYPDSPLLPHIFIVEASGRSSAPPPTHPMLDEFRRDVAVR
jgi:predicted SAM-dependent methyltransferase